MTVTDLTFEEWSVYCEPLQWTGKYVYIRSIEATGYVSSSTQYSGNPASNTITVELVDENGQLGSGIMVPYTMDGAREDLILGIDTLVMEDSE